MYARNFRRREVSQRKKDGSGGGTPGADSMRDLRMEEGSSGDGVRSYVPSPPPATASLSSSNNPSNFCNDLLTAASIIESQTSSAAGKEEDCKFCFNAVYSIIYLLW